jgi:uncharacterized protein with FMN-binding domain
VGESMRRVLLAVAGSAVVAIMLIGLKGTQSPAVSNTTGGGPLGEGPTGGPSIRPGKVTLPAGSYDVTGPAIDTPFGPVQVRIVVSGGHVTDVVAIQIPHKDGRSRDINTYAGPLLLQEALQAQSADIHVVSGATYTTAAYAQSLQAALDKAAAGRKDP